MLHYVRGRFRDSSSDAVPLRLSLGEAELLEMETYHKAREVFLCYVILFYYLFSRRGRVNRD